jgi:hypothetical protein
MFTGSPCGVRDEVHDEQLDRWTSTSDQRERPSSAWSATSLKRLFGTRTASDAASSLNEARWLEPGIEAVTVYLRLDPREDLSQRFISSAGTGLGRVASEDNEIPGISRAVREKPDPTRFQAGRRAGYRENQQIVQCQS